MSVSAAVAQQKTTGKMAGNAEATKAELIKLDQEWGAATVRNDVEFSKKFVADDCLFTEADGTVTTKARMIQEIESGKSKTTANQASEYNVRLLGPDIAVIRHNLTATSINNGKDTSGEFRRMHVMVRRNGRWVVIDSQSVRVGPVTMAVKQ
ncbi:nuclear transport factor 2 family protein [Hymenobacter fastidiosus]|uniref:nuclear transport factor 2 family protein n=1 Tax=Hymenobacter fastidiosus TaxID=486264 RepID=UPI0031EA98C1